MKALALDTSVSCIQIAAKNGDNLASLVLDIGMRQSEKLLPAIEYVMKQADLSPADLDYTVLCEGPGSFTGLRLGFAALKAIELYGGRSAGDENCSQDQNAAGEQNFLQDQNAAASRIPLYAINTLDFLAQPFLDLGGVVLPIIDAHKEKFYAKAFFNGKEILPCDDWDLRVLEEKVLAALGGNCSQDQSTAASGDSSQAKDAARDGNCSQDLNAGGGSIFVCGLEANVFAEACKENGLFKGMKIVAPKSRVLNMESLFALAEEKIARKEPPLADYDGPQYFRASEAEQNNARQQN